VGRRIQGEGLATRFEKLRPRTKWRKKKKAKKAKIAPCWKKECQDEKKSKCKKRGRAGGLGLEDTRRQRGLKDKRCPGVV